MRSTTEGMNAALNGVLWRPGDEIITTHLEHICLFAAIGASRTGSASPCAP